MNLAADFTFAAESLGQGGEFKNAAQLLRYVAALNPEASRVEFVAAAVAAGYAANSSANRFRESRKFDATSYGIQFDADGRAVEQSNPV